MIPFMLLHFWLYRSVKAFKLKTLDTCIVDSKLLHSNVALVRDRVEHLMTPFTQRFGTIQRRVCIAQEVFGLVI